MKYKQVAIPVDDPALTEMLIARLSDIGFDGFEETSGTLLAFIPYTAFNEQEVRDILSPEGLSCTTSDIEPQNWNAQWEESFQPVTVPGFCTVRAHFHDINVDTPYDIVITPQMSFGTGHHATTMLMMMQMQHLDMESKTVLDFGTGTGILAILSEKLKAQTVVAIDNDIWAYENALENIERNHCTKISARHGILNEAGQQQFDIILANINRHILLDNMNALFELTTAGGNILMSGLLKEDLELVKEAAETTGFSMLTTEELSGWIVILFIK